MGKWTSQVWHHAGRPGLGAAGGVCHQCSGVPWQEGCGECKFWMSFAKAASGMFIPVWGFSAPLLVWQGSGGSAGCPCSSTGPQGWC